jgi:MFS family permease
MAFIGMSFFLGWTVSSLFIPRLSDILGRKPAFLGSLMLQTMAMIGMNFSQSVHLTTALMFFLGMGCVGTRSICYLYLMELLPKKW